MPDTDTQGVAQPLPFHLDRLNAWLTDLWAAESLTLHMCDGTVRTGQSGVLRDIRDDVMALRRAYLSAAQEPDYANLLSVITDIRMKSGLGAKPMLSELADAIGNLRARAERAEEAFGIAVKERDQERSLNLPARELQEENAALRAQVERLEIELEDDRAIVEENADNVRLLDKISDMLGVPHDEELTIQHVADRLAAQSEDKWAIDRSTDSPILTYEKCSVIQDEQAFYVLGLIRAAQEGREAVAWLRVEKRWHPDRSNRRDVTLDAGQAREWAADSGTESVIPLFTHPAPAQPAAQVVDIDALAQEIRRVDGSNTLGAGALAEALAPFLSALASPTDAQGGGQPCEDCGRPALVWFAPNALWNRVKGGPDATDDPGGHLCPSCFIVRAEKAGIQPTAWIVSEEDLASPTDADASGVTDAEVERAARAYAEHQNGKGCPVWEEELPPMRAALTAAGYRILAPGELDRETVERCAGIAAAFADSEGNNALAGLAESTGVGLEGISK